MEIYELKQTLRELLGNLLKRIDQIVALYQDLNYAVANERLIFLTEDLSVFVEGLSVCQKGNGDANIAELNEKLESILQELEQKDYLLVADLLTYELKPALEEWEAQLVDA